MGGVLCVPCLLASELYQAHMRQVKGDAVIQFVWGCKDASRSCAYWRRCVEVVVCMFLLAHGCGTSLLLEVWSATVCDKTCSTAVAL